MFAKVGQFVPLPLLLLLLLLILERCSALRSCRSDESCVTELLCQQSDDSGRGKLVARTFDRSCGAGLVCCDQEQLKSFNATDVRSAGPTSVPVSVYKSCSSSPAQPMECVPRYLCNGTANDNGRYLIHPRIDHNSNFGCKPLEHCCPIADQLDASDSPLTRNAREFKYKYKGCGYSNQNGLYFDMVGYKDHEALFGEFPWMLALFDMQGAYVCGGTLIHPSLALTSAHNVLNHNAKDLVVRAGEWDLNSVEEPHPYQTRPIRHMQRHEQFNRLTHYNDISFLVLEQPFELAPHIQPLCLPPPESPQVLAQLRGAQCFATGWGRINITSEFMEFILKRIDLPVLENGKCQQLLRRTILGGRYNLHPSFLCAGGIKGKDTCKGDGGSPLFCTLPNETDRYVLAGIVSWGLECAEEEIPAAYANVPHLRDWIDQQVAQNGFQLNEP